MRVAPDKRSAVRGNEVMNIPSFHGPPRQPAGWRGGPWKQGDVVRGRLPRAAFAALFCPGLLSPCPSGAADGAS